LARRAGRFTPRRGSGAPVSAGMEHILQGHFNRASGANRSVFTVSVRRFCRILKRRSVVRSAVHEGPSGQFVRTVDVGEVVGRSAIRNGGMPTTWMRIFTDVAGNISTAFPL
jgi:hypothetical protein